MPPRKKTTDVGAAVLPSSMKELKDTLWKAADKLRGSMDASQYKDVIQDSGHGVRIRAVISWGF